MADGDDTLSAIRVLEAEHFGSSVVCGDPLDVAFPSRKAIRGRLIVTPIPKML